MTAKFEQCVASAMCVFVLGSREVGCLVRECAWTFASLRYPRLDSALLRHWYCLQWEVVSAVVC
jgi:hypothetical protein